MRLAFSVILLVVAIVYTYLAFFGLSFLTISGRMGPGFIPRIIGVALVLSLLCIIPRDIRTLRLEYHAGGESAMDAIIFITFTLLFGVMLIVVGYLVAIPVYVGVMLFYFNKNKHVINVVITLAALATIHFLFGSALNASLPHGMWW